MCCQYARSGCKTSAIALTNATLPYAVEIENKRRIRAARENIEIKRGVNITAGKTTHPAAVNAFGLSHLPLD